MNNKHTIFDDLEYITVGKKARYLRNMLMIEAVRVYGKHRRGLKFYLSQYNYSFFSAITKHHKSIEFKQMRFFTL